MMELRPDLQVISDMVGDGCSVLDVGCGEGELLGWLVRHKHADGRGMELIQANVNRAIAQGLAVVQGNGDTDLSDYPDKAYDYVILSQTLQTLADPKAVLEQLVRIGKQAVVSVPNFGHWKNRLYLAFRGRMPVTRSLSYQWYDTPNIHFCTINDFIELCELCGITIHRQVMVNQGGEKVRFRGKGWRANLFGEQGVFLISQHQTGRG